MSRPWMLQALNGAALMIRRVPHVMSDTAAIALTRTAQKFNEPSGTRLRLPMERTAPGNRRAGKTAYP